MKNTTTSCGLVLLALAGMRPVLAQAEARAQLARAVVIEEEERDVARAVAEYRKVVAAATDAGLRAEAGVHLGTALLAMGKKDEARAVLEPLAAAGGTLGERARTLLQDQQQDDPVFAARVREALALTRRLPDQGANELGFLGRGVVPHLMQALRVGESDPLAGQPRPVERSFLAAAVKVLCKLGGPQAAEGLRELAKHSDVVVRRTCAEQLDDELAQDLAPAAHAFLADADASVRLAAAGRLQWRIDTDALAKLMQDADANVREFAHAHAAARSGPNPPVEPPPAMLAAARAELARPEPVRSLVGFVRLLGGTAEGRSIWLTLMRHPRALKGDLQLPLGVTFAPNAHADEVVETAAAVEARGDRDGLRMLSRLVHPASGTWDRSVLPQALRLARLGAFEGCGQWLARVAKAEDMPAILAHLDVLDLRGDAGKWLLQQSLPAAAWKDVAAALEARRGHDDQDVYPLVALLLRSRADEAVPAALSIATEARRFGWVCKLFAEQEAPTPAMVDGMVALIGRETGEGQLFATARNDLFLALAPRGKDEHLPALARAYVRGLNASYVRGETLRGLQCVVPKSAQARAVPVGFAARLVEACLATLVEAAFLDALEMIQRAGNTTPDVHAALCRYALAAPTAELRQGLVSSLLRGAEGDAEAARALYVAALRSEDEAVSRQAVGMVPRGGVPADAVPLLVARARDRADGDAIRALGRSGDAQQAPLLRQLLQHADFHVRWSALGALADLQGTDAVDALLPLASDPDHNVRQQFTEVAARLLDRRLAPGLLEVLRDEVPLNRESAQKALEAIEFFHTQTARWQRILSDANLDAPSAAEALVKQATTGKDKTIRLAAIASLGTLKVPETLPVLIQLMQDADAEIAAAARAAVAKINGQ